MTLRVFAAALLVLLLTACDAADSNEAPSETLAGRWVAPTTFDHDRTWVLPAWASQDSVRYTYTGSQLITLTLDDQDGSVTGSIDWDEAGALTVTTWNDGAASNQGPSSFSQNETDAVRATFAAPTLTFDHFSNAMISTQLEVDDGRINNFKLAFDDGVGEAAYTHRVIETMYRGPNGEQFVTEVAMPITLTFQRMP
jgi:YD repeat-containing protein